MLYFYFLKFFKLFEYFIFDFFNYYFFSFFEDLITVFMFYNFFKLLLMCVINELIWPTQYFNKKHNIGYQTYRLRTYSEVILKLRNLNSYNYIFYLLFYKNLILK